MSSLCRGSSIDPSYQVWDHLVKRFQIRIFKCERLTDNRRAVIAKAYITFGMLGWLEARCLRRTFKLYTGPSIGASYQISIHLATQFQRFLPIRNKNSLWRPCLLTNRDEMIHLYRGPSIDASYQVSVHLGKRFQRRRFFLEIHQSETRIVCGGHVW